MPYGYTKNRFSRYRPRSAVRRTGGKISGFRRRPRRMSRRSRGPRKQGWSSTIRRFSRYAGTAGKALGLASKVYSLINPEFKYVDNDSLNINITNTSTGVALITSIGQGNGVSNRNGNSILAKYIACTFNLKYNNLASPTATRITVVSTLDGPAPTAAQIYENVASGSSTVLSKWKKNSDIAYKVHFDKVFHVDQYRPQMIHKYSIKLGRHHVKYTGASPTDTGPGNFWLMATTDTASATNFALFSRLFRIAYIDN